MFYYRPVPDYAYMDMKTLEYAVQFGIVLRNLHRWGAHLMVICVMLHMLRVFLTGSYRPPREFNWVVGVSLLVLTLLLSFTGYLLPWDQLAFWAVTVGTNMAAATPFIGAEGPFHDCSGRDADERRPLPVARRHEGRGRTRCCGSTSCTASPCRWCRDHHDDGALLAGAEGRRHFAAAVTGTRTGSMADEPSTTRVAAIEPSRPVRGNEVAVFPYLVYKEFLAALLISIVLLVWSLAVERAAAAGGQPGQDREPGQGAVVLRRPAGAAGLLRPLDRRGAMPTLIIVGLMTIPYLDTTRHAVGRYTLRRGGSCIWHFLFGFALWWVLIAIGQFLRGPNWQFYWPWEDWAVAKSAEVQLWSFPWWVGLPLLVGYFAAGVLLPRRCWPWLYAGLGRRRYVVVVGLRAADVRRADQDAPAPAAGREVRPGDAMVQHLTRRSRGKEASDDARHARDAPRAGHPQPAVPPALCVVAIYSEETRQWMSYQEQFTDLYRTKATGKAPGSQGAERGRRGGPLAARRSTTCRGRSPRSSKCTSKTSRSPTAAPPATRASTTRCSRTRRSRSSHIRASSCSSTTRTSSAARCAIRDRARRPRSMGRTGAKPNWPTPMLPLAYVQASCGRCHGVDARARGAEQSVRRRPVHRTRLLRLPRRQGHQLPAAVFAAVERAAAQARRAAQLDLHLGQRPGARQPRHGHAELHAGGRRRRQDHRLPALAARPEAVRQGESRRRLREDGKRLFTERGCRGCHGVKADEHSASRRIPHLAGIGSKVTPEWLDRWIADPKAYNPETAMPKLELKDDERHAIVAYLLTLKRKEPLPAAPDLRAFNVEEGKELVRQYECFGCHEIPGFEKMRPSVPDLAEFARKPVDELDFGTHHGRAADQVGLARSQAARAARLRNRQDRAVACPRRRSTDDERASDHQLRAGARRPSPADTLHGAGHPGAAGAGAIRRWMVAHLNCGGCHRLADRDPNIARYFERKNMVPPNLQDVGARLQGQYMYQFVMEPKQVRPWLKMRMPTFGFTEAQARTLRRGLRGLRLRHQSVHLRGEGKHRPGPLPARRAPVPASTSACSATRRRSTRDCPKASTRRICRST